MKIQLSLALLLVTCALAIGSQAAAQESAPAAAAVVPAAETPKPAVATPNAIDYPMHQGWVDSRGVMIYYETVGRGAPIVIVHGGPGDTHDYFLPYLLPLARRNKLVFIDERGSGKSGHLEDPSGYTVGKYGRRRGSRSPGSRPRQKSLCSGIPTAAFSRRPTR